MTDLLVGALSLSTLYGLSWLLARKSKSTAMGVFAGLMISLLIGYGVVHFVSFVGAEVLSLING